MRIGIDARKLSGGKTGIGYYAYHVLRALIENDDNNEYYLYSDRKIELDFHKDNMKLVVLPFLQNLNKFEKLISPLWLNTVLVSRMKKDRIDVYYSPNFFRPIMFRKQAVVTVHDLSFHTVPQAFSRVQRTYNKFFLRMTLRPHVKVLTVSEHSKKDIMKYYGVPEHQISITYCAVDRSKFRPIEELDPTRNQPFLEKHKLTEPYLLFVGTVEPRKNIATVIQALRILKERGELKYKFVICGKKGLGYDQIEAAVVEHGLSENIQFTGYVEDRDLPYLYSNALMLLYPSIYEGFGIPPLEAMASGVPVVTSNVSSLPEVVGDAAVQIHPYDAQALADSIHQVAVNQELRQRLIRKGQERIHLFDWQESASVFRQTLEGIGYGRTVPGVLQKLNQ